MYHKKQDTIQKITYLEFVKKIEAEYKTDSIEYLLTFMYGIPELIARNDFKSLVLIKSKNDDIDKINYIVVPVNRQENCTIILNTFKTVKKFEKQEYEVDTFTSNLIRAYITKHNRKYKELLFKENLSKIMSETVKKMGYKGGINFIRSIRITEGKKKQMTAEERVEQANKALHSVSAEKIYTRRSK